MERERKDLGDVERKKVYLLKSSRFGGVVLLGFEAALLLVHVISLLLYNKTDDVMVSVLYSLRFALAIPALFDSMQGLSFSLDSLEYYSSVAFRPRFASVTTLAFLAWSSLLTAWLAMKVKSNFNAWFGLVLAFWSVVDATFATVAYGVCRQVSLLESAYAHKAPTPTQAPATTGARRGWVAHHLAL